MKRETTQRGFGIYQFKDSSGMECNIQKSSSAIQDHIWLGAEKIGLKEFRAGEGWKDRTEFDDTDTISHHFIANSRMHLTRDQVAELLPILTQFVETGEI